MVSDFIAGSTADPENVVTASKHRGAFAHAGGMSAEQQVAAHYQRQGAELLAERWRGQAGELDLAFNVGDEIVLVEVKASRTHAAAASHLRPQQTARLLRAAEEFLGTQPLGSLTPMRFDLAMIDAQGRIEVIENALMAG